MPAAATVVIEAAGQTHTIGASLAATIRVHRPRRAN
jgi:DNA-directed RNA polymerase subunit L